MTKTKPLCTHPRPLENVRPWPGAREILGHDLSVGECPDCKSTLNVNS